MLSISSGHSVDYLTEGIAGGRESYYTGAVAAGEPPGRWDGAGAEKLGLVGLVDSDTIASLYSKFIDPRDGETVLGHAGRNYLSAEERFEKLLAAEPDAAPERREHLRLEAARGQQNVPFYDATFNAQKSVTVLHAAFEAQEVAARNAGDLQAAEAWAAHRVAVEEAIWAGNRAMLHYLAEHAGYSRTGDHGGNAGRWTDTPDLTVASFFQHDSRNHDPHLHIHNAILNRVQCTDGKWRTLDGKALGTFKPAASAMAERVMFEHLTRTLGVRVAMRPDGKSREIVGVDERVMDLFSSRSRAITPKVAGLVEVFEQRFGHDPNALQLWRIKQRATLATRRTKEHTGETTEQRLERWDRELRAELAGGLAGVAHKVLGLVDERQRADAFPVKAVLETALADVQATKAAWTRSDLVRSISDALPDYLGGLDADRIEVLLHGLTDQAIEQYCTALTAAGPAEHSVPEDLRLRNGDSCYSRPGVQLYATTEHIRSERFLRAAAVERGMVATSPELAAVFVRHLAEAGTELGVDQANAVQGMLTDQAKVSSLVGPAGTGKSMVVGVVAKAWTDPTLWNGIEQRVFGLATSQIATNVLTGEGLTARNVASWLGAQGRLAAGGTYPDDQQWQLRGGDLVVVDESAMSNTADLAAIRGHTEKAGAKLLLTGDHRQLAAVGAGGGMSMVAATGASYELAEVRRFTAAWEREASLRLREGDQDALVEYRKHGRIVDGGAFDDAADRAARGYLADTLAGLDTRLVVDTNEQAAVLSAKVRDELVRLGHVHEDGVPLAQDTTAGVGDLVEARKLAWDLAGYEGNRRGPVTRERYRVLDVREDGALVVGHIISRDAGGEHLGDRLTLPATYVGEHLALGYASTSYSVQGQTVDTCHSVGTATTSRAGQYVPLTRGRDCNTMYVATIGDASDVKSAATVAEQRRDALVVLSRTEELDAPDRAAVVEAEVSHAEMTGVQTPAERLADVAELATAGRTAAMLDRLTTDGVLSESQRLTLATDEALGPLSTVLRQAEVAGHDPLQVLTDAVTERDLESARSIATVLHDRINKTVDLEPKGDRHTDWVPAVADPSWQRHLVDLAQAADTRRDELGLQMAKEAPQWAVEALGPVPEELREQVRWVERAGAVASHRELTGHTAEDTALPGPPPRGQVEGYASWRAAWRALGRPEDHRAEQEMSDGQLRVRVRAMEREETWAPPYVVRDLSGTIQAAERNRQTAEIRGAQAAAATDATERARLQREAADAAVLADTLGRQAAVLDAADTERAKWYAHTAETRAAEQRARLELGARGVNVDELDGRVTAAEWLAEHRADLAVEEPAREITDADVDERPADAQVVSQVREVDVVETAVTDIREVAEHEPSARCNIDDWDRVPTPGEVAESVERAQRALAEREARQAVDAQRDAEEAHTAALARVQAEERAREDAQVAEFDEPVLPRGELA